MKSYAYISQVLHALLITDHVPSKQQQLHSKHAQIWRRKHKDRYSTTAMRGALDTLLLLLQTCDC